MNMNTSGQLISGLQNVLATYGISYSDIHLDGVQPQTLLSLFDNFESYATKFTKTSKSVEVDCVLKLLQEFTSEDEENARVVEKLIGVLPLCRLTTKSIAHLVDALRIGVRLLPSVGVRSSISTSFQNAILRMLQTCIVRDNPSHISFSGDKESFVQISGIPVNHLKSYTINMWLKLDPPSSGSGGGTRGFILYRCRSPSSGIDAIISTNPATEGEGNYTLMMRTNTEKRGKGEIQCKLRLEVGKWHLVTVQQFVAVASGVERMALFVDGEQCGEEELPFPFLSPTPTESLWVFGLGFRGLLSSATMYPEELSPDLLTLLYHAGPYITDMTAGVSCPQSSFDTGHMVLGTQLAKGRLASKSYRSSPVFSIKAATLVTDAALPLCSTGKLHEEHIEMLSPPTEYDAPLIAAMTGGCAVHLGGSWVENLSECGGVSLLLYLFWTYSDALCGKVFSGPNAARDGNFICLHSCLKSSLRVLSSVIRTSADLKEQLVQLHGFHVLAHCLSTVPAEVRRAVVDEELADLCLELAGALGPDGVKGDAAAAVLQGLLFDFRVWGSCTVAVLQHYLEHLATWLLPAGAELYSSVGLQRILDVFRLHVARLAPASSSSQTNDPATIALQRSVTECSDSMHRLLIITMDAARAQAMRNKANLSAEAELLLRCLEESSSSLVAERLLRLIGNMRVTSPNSLLQALFTVRFHDTVLVGLLMKRGMSLEVRSGAFVNLLWLLGEELRVSLQQVAQSRKTLNGILSAFASSGVGPNKNRANGGRNGTVKHHMTALDANRVKSLTALIRESVKPLEKAWSILTMVVEVLARSLVDGAWGKCYRSELVMPEQLASNTVRAGTVVPLCTDMIDMNTFVTTITHSGQIEAWLLLPILPTVLSRCSATTALQALMSLNVMFKQDACQSEALCSLSDRAWIQLFVSLALMGEVAFHRGGTIGAEEAVAASTGTELVLDSLSIVVEYKTRLHVNESWSTWNCLQNCFKSACGAQFGPGTQLAEETELRLLKRCISLVFQRLAKCADGWNSYFITVIVNILTFVDSRKLCGGLNTAKTSAVQDYCLLDVDDASLAPKPQFIAQSSDEGQILCFMLDMMQSLRKASEGGALGGAEWPAVKLVHKITLSCLSFASEPVADRVAAEILAHLKYLSEPWVRLSEVYFKNAVTGILRELRAVIKNKLSPDYLRGRYSALIFAILHFFIDIRHSIAEGRRVPHHVLDTLDALVGIDNCADLDLVFKLLDVTMFKDTGAISFEDALDAPPSVQQPDHSVGSSASLSHSPAVGGEMLLLDMSSSPPGGGGGATLLDLFDLDALAAREELPDSSSHGRDQDPDFLSSPEEDRHDSADSVENRLGFHLVDGVAACDDLVEVSVPAASEVSSGETLTAEQIERQARESRFQNWLKVRQGISAEWVDSDRARLSRSMDSLDLSSEATKKFWKKARRKVESEALGEAHKCQWKLGVAHEGHFPSRKRVVLRPRFDNEYGAYAEGPSVDPEGNSRELTESRNSGDDLSGLAAGTSEELDRALAKACAGYITDVTRDEKGHGAEDQDSKSAGEGGASGGKLTNDSSHGVLADGVKVPGTGWGLVDADGSEEGYGVVGLTLSDTSPTSPPVAADSANKAVTARGTSNEATVAVPAQDQLGDVRQVEENFRLGKANATGPCHSGTRRVDSGPSMLDASVILITASGNFWGQLSFNGKEIFFTSSSAAGSGHAEDSAAVTLSKNIRMRRRRWVLSSVSAIYLRRFRLRDSALEVFFSRGKHRNFFVDFGHTRENAKQRNDFARALMTAAPSTAFKQLPTMSHFRLVYDHGVQEKWLNGRLSNFDYLMALNTIAGRSYNDLCQYPVFPWVICDYESATLDLRDPAVYRDLSKPMGALNASRLAEFMDRFNSFEENVTSGIPPFMYGSHYSTMVGVVLHFLVRLQPFAALHKEMQNGHFDVPDRLFSSIPRSYRHNTNQLSEVKELTPEWFTTPDMFRNVNRFAFGQTQDDEEIGDVELPPWAATPEEFVRINREALESDYVSEHLHEWIDLIFGHKQRGPDAVEAHNVFYYLTYYGSVDHYMIEDETLRRATELQIAHFGQIPMQLFKIPHPAKKVIGGRSAGNSSMTRPIRRCFTENSRESFVKPTCDEECIATESAATLVNRNTNSAPVAVSVLNDRLLCVSDNGVVDVLRYSTSEEAKSALMIAAAAPKPPAGSGSLKKRSPVTNTPEVSVSAGPPGTNSEVISFDDPFDIFGPSSAKATSAMGAGTSKTPSIQSKEGSVGDSESGRDSFDTCASRPHNIMERSEPLIFVEREFSHFDVVPRIPLPKPSHGRGARRTSTDYSTSRDSAYEALCKVTDTACSSESQLEHTAQLVCFSKAGNIAISAGLIDGRVGVRELDSRTGFVKTAGDFRAHKRRVVSVSADAIPFASTEVVATIDEGGQLLVWTISRVRAGASGVNYNYVISRRPQRLFRCTAAPDLHCDISWQMGIVVAAAGLSLHVFSIERDEQLGFFELDVTPGDDSASSEASIGCEGSGYSYTGPLDHAFGQPHSTTNGDHFQRRCVIRRLALCDSGFIVLHVERFSMAEVAMTGLDEDHHLLLPEHVLMVYSLSGRRTAYHVCASPVTHLSCPDRGEVLLTGHHDGSVRFFGAQDLKELFAFSPHLNCTQLVLGLVPVKPGNHDAPRKTNATKDKGASQGRSPARPVAADPSPVVCVCVGPNKSFPSIVVVTTESGNIYFRALPDFVKWEKGRSPSALAQLASVPMQAVRGTIQQAQNWTAETAGVLAQNARSLADDALGELKKMKRNSVVKGVASFFGLGKKVQTEDSDDEPAGRK